MAPWLSLRRLAYIMFVVVKHSVAHTWGLLSARLPILASARSQVSLSGPERLRTALEDLGGSFIKFGQMLALQPDILSLEYCDELFDLLDRCTPFDHAQVERIFKEETGKSPADVFAAFEKRPIATASIGQVHVGFLGARKVAIKVQRPNVETEFAGDIYLMMATVHVIKRLRLAFLYWMIEPITEFVGWTREELDYRFEARYMEQLRLNASGNPAERVPEVIWEYTTRRLLVTEFLEGDTVLAYLRAMGSGDELMLRRLKSFGFDAHEVARRIIHNFLGDAFQHGIFHADLHPANLMILPGNIVGYVDFGITGVISRYSRQNLIALTLAYTRGNLEGMCEAFFNVCALDVQSDRQAFRNGLKRLADGWYEMGGNRRRLRKNFTLVMLDMLRLSRATSIWPERDVIKYIRSSIAIDGLITRFAPGFDVGHYLEEVCDSHLKWQVRKSLVAYNTLVGWASTSEHLMRDGAFRAAGFLRQISTEENPIGSDSRVKAARVSNSLRSRMVLLGGVMFGISVYISIIGEPVKLGFNVFTAEIILMVGAALMLWRNLNELSRVKRRMNTESGTVG